MNVTIQPNAARLYQLAAEVARSGRDLTAFDAGEIVAQAIAEDGKIDAAEVAAVNAGLRSATGGPQGRPVGLTPEAAAVFELNGIALDRGLKAAMQRRRLSSTFERDRVEAVGSGSGTQSSGRQR